jgi:hypothetical protein
MPTQPADPDLRRRTLLLVALGLALSSAGFLLLQSWITDLQSRPPREALAALLTALRWSTAVMTALLLGFAGYLWHFAARVRRDQRFPPEGQRVIRDTRILQGEMALRRAGVLRVLSVALALASLTLIAVSFRLAAALGGMALS